MKRWGTPPAQVIPGATSIATPAHIFEAAVAAPDRHVTHMPKSAHPAS
jgi:hypothetical protein